MKKYKKWFILCLAIALLMLAIKIISVPEYHGGRSYVSYSPDGKYRIDFVQPLKSSKAVRIVTSLADEKVKAIVPLSIGFEGSVNPVFLCTSDSSRCYQHVLGVDEEIIVLPPLPWTILHAWLTIKFKELEDPQLKIVNVSTRYPPVNK